MEEQAPVFPVEVKVLSLLAVIGTLVYIGVVLSSSLTNSTQYNKLKYDVTHNKDLNTDKGGRSKPSSSSQQQLTTHIAKRKQCLKRIEEWASNNTHCMALSTFEYETAFPCALKNEKEIQNEIKIEKEKSEKKRKIVKVSVMGGSPNKERLIAVHDTWGKLFGENIFYAVDTAIPDLPLARQWIMNSTNLTSAPDYDGAQWRSLYGLLYATNVDNFLGADDDDGGADWVLMVDDDTFVNPLALKISFVDRYAVDIPAVFGFAWMRPNWNKVGCWLSGGAGMLLTRAAAKRIATNRFKGCFSDLNDLTISQCAKKENILLVHSALFSPDIMIGLNAESEADVAAYVTIHRAYPERMQKWYTLLSKQWQRESLNETFVANILQVEDNKR